jgi:hypothetical protein
VKFGIVLDAPGSEGDFLAVESQLNAARSAGFELVWLEDGQGPHSWSSPTVACAFLGARHEHLAFVIALSPGPHPVRLAEEIAVADLAVGGRVIVVIKADGDPAISEETIDILQLSWAPRPFRFAGAHWRVEERVAEGQPHSVRVTPSPWQLAMQLWIRGAHGSDVARPRGLSHVVEWDGRAGVVPDDADGMPEPRAHGLRRPGVVTAPILGNGLVDSGALLKQLRAAQLRWGLDIAIVRLPAECPFEARAEQIISIGHDVRPFLQLEMLPAGLEGYWHTTGARGASPSLCGLRNDPSQSRSEHGN